MTASGQSVVILLVEDSPDDVFFFRRAIQKSAVPAVIHVATDGLEAMDYLLNKGRFADATAHPAPDIMFLDLKLPNVNGFEVLEWMRQQSASPRPPVVVLTSSNQPADREQATELGALLFLTKPPSGEQLRELLQKYPISV
jgi:CheY-like chemotaxis protein